MRASAQSRPGPGRVDAARRVRDPAEWMPPAASAACRHITDRVRVDIRWLRGGIDLRHAADPAEHAAIARTAAGRDDPITTDTLAA